MEVFTANEAKNRFGDVLMKSQKAPVQVTKSGKPVAMVVSMEDYQAMDDLKAAFLKEKLARSQVDIENGRVENYDIFFTDLMAGKHDK